MLGRVLRGGLLSRYGVKTKECGRSCKRSRTSIGFERHGHHAWAAAGVALGGKDPKWMPRKFMIQMKNYSISTEDTPNPHSVKFYVGSASIPEEAVNEEFKDGSLCDRSPVARKLLYIAGVNRVLFGQDFLTVNKDEDYEWVDIEDKIIETIMEHLKSGESLILPMKASRDAAEGSTEDGVISEIKDLLDSRIRPFVQADGGDVAYNHFDESTGTVYVKLKGACVSCPSSKVTVRFNIRNMLCHYIEEVNDVKEIDEDECGNDDDNWTG